MGVKVSNNAFGTLSAGINTSDTTITLDSGQGARFPSLGAGDYFYGTIVDTSNNIEIVKVTARSSDSMTVVRGQDSTTATAFAIGDRFELRPTAALFEAIASEAEDYADSAATLTGLGIDDHDKIAVTNGTTGEVRLTALSNQGQDDLLVIAHQYHRDVGINFKIGTSNSTATAISSLTEHTNLYVDAGDPSAGRDSNTIWNRTGTGRGEFRLDMIDTDNTDNGTGVLGSSAFITNPEGDMQIRVSSIRGEGEHPVYQSHNCTQTNATSGNGSSSGGDADCGVCVSTSGSISGCSEGTGAAYNWWNFKSYCEKAGLRLCTSAEVQAGAANGSGCSHDSRAIWTSTPDGNGKYYYVQGNSPYNPTARYPYDASAPNTTIAEFGVRCCGQNSWS